MLKFPMLIGRPFAVSPVTLVENAAKNLIGNVNSQSKFDEVAVYDHLASVLASALLGTLDGNCR